MACYHDGDHFHALGEHDNRNRPGPPSRQKRPNSFLLESAPAERIIQHCHGRAYTARIHKNEAFHQQSEPSVQLSVEDSREVPLLRFRLVRSDLLPKLTNPRFETDSELLRMRQCTVLDCHSVDRMCGVFGDVERPQSKRNRDEQRPVCEMLAGANSVGERSALHGTRTLRRWLTCVQSPS